MDKEKINALYESLRAEKNALEGKIRDAVFDILNQLPNKTASFIDNHAYCYVEGEENFIEVPVFGIRINKKTIELSFAADYDEDTDKDVPSWSNYDIRTECDNYTDINWLSILYNLT